MTGGVEERFCGIDAVGIQKMRGGISGCLFEQRTEINGGEPDGLGKLFDGKIRIGMVIRDILQRMIDVVGVGGLGRERFRRVIGDR